MKFTRIIKKLTPKLSIKSFLALTMLVLGGGLAFNIAQAEFYPDREPFDYNKPCNPDDADIYDRCGSLTGPVFNSFVNTPYYGDERAFADARRSDQPASGPYKNVLPDVTEGSQEVVIRTYIHNNANQSTNASGLGIATGAKVRVFLPTATSNSLRARSYVTADNAALVEDTVDFTAAGNFSMEYVPGSAIMYNHGPFAGGVAISDSIVTTGAPIGYDSLNGNLPGCFDYAAVVEIRVKIVPDIPTSTNLTKQVRFKGETEWKQEVNSKPGDTLQWLLTTTVNGSQQDNMIIRDVIAPHNTVVPGSVRRIDANYPNQILSDGPLFDGGFNVGTYIPGGGFYIIYDTVVDGNFDPCEVRVRNQAFVRSDQQTTELKATADAVIDRECDEPNPVVKCDSLSAPRLSLNIGESTEFTAVGTATDTSITGYIFKVNGEIVKESNNANDNKYTFTATEAGTFTVAATVKSPIGNYTSVACEKNITVEEEPEVSLKCDNLTAPRYTIRLGESVDFTASATAENTTITGYQFTVDGTEVQNTSSNKYTYTGTELGEYFVRVTVAASNGQTATSNSCVKSITVEEVPAVTCDSLSAPHLTLNRGDKTVFTAEASATNATITGYVFTVDGVEVQAGIENKYTFVAGDPGKYDVAVTVMSSEGPVTSPECVKTVDVVEEIVPIYRCEEFYLSKNRVKVGESFTATVRVTAKDGATFKLAIFHFGDEEKAVDQYSTNNINSGVVKATHSYSEVGDYGPRVILDFDVNGEMVRVEDPSCVATIKVYEDEKPELPDTGAGSIAGLMAVTTAAGSLMHRKRTLKRNK